jgi:hypothetical protein
LFSFQPFFLNAVFGFSGSNDLAEVASIEYQSNPSTGEQAGITTTYHCLFIVGTLLMYFSCAIVFYSF